MTCYNVCMSPKDIERFLPKIKKTDKCWIWLGAANTNGYGEFSLNGKCCKAHRISYEFYKEETIPKNLVIDHLCRNKMCVNPDHLEIVTAYINTMRGNSPHAINARKIRCRNGHILNENTVKETKLRNGRSRRRCLVCCRLRQRAYRKRLKESNQSGV